MSRYALLIGVSEYEKGLSSLPAATNDVVAMQTVLENPEIGDFEVKTLISKERQQIEEAIEQLFSNCKKDDVLVLFFSGHGIKDESGKLFLAARNTRKRTDGELSRPTAIAASFIQEAMHSCRCKRKIVILDCCFSGAFPAGMSVKDDGSVPIAQQLGGEGWAVLTSSTSTQYSLESQGFDLSVYTHFLVEGIRTGSADRDQDGDISVEELHDYAKEMVLETAPGKMTPEIYSPTEGRKIVLARVPSSNSPELFDSHKLRQKQRWAQFFLRSSIRKKFVTAAITTTGSGLVVVAGVFLISHDWRSLTATNLFGQERSTSPKSEIPTPSERGTSSPSVATTAEIDIKGTWNSEVAQKVVTMQLQNANWKTLEDFCSITLAPFRDNPKLDSCEPDHSFLGEYSLPYKDRTVEIVATATIEKFPIGSIAPTHHDVNGKADCHPCAPYLSFFEFEKRPTGWKLVNSYIAAFRWGAWGKIRPEEVNVYAIGNNIFGIQLEGIYTGQGIAISSTSVYANVRDSWREVLSLLTGRNNKAELPPENKLEVWDSKLAFQTCTTGFCDLIVQRDGIREGKPFHEKELFKFNGQKYISDKLYQ